MKLAPLNRIHDCVLKGIFRRYQIIAAGARLLHELVPSDGLGIQFANLRRIRRGNDPVAANDGRGNEEREFAKLAIELDEQELCPFFERLQILAPHFRIEFVATLAAACVFVSNKCPDFGAYCVRTTFE